MKIAAFSIPELKAGKYNVKDERLDQVDKITKAKKKTYIQVEVAGEDALLDADCLVVPKDSAADIILRDLEFIETRASRSADEKEKSFLGKLKGILEKEEFIFGISLDEEEKKLISSYGLASNRPVVTARKEDLEDPNTLLSRCVREGGLISFFTTGEKETRAWLIRKGITAHEAAGSIHSDIQRGFIRAEIISFNDFISSGGETAAKQAGKMRLESKEYVMQDADLVNFRFNK